MLGIGLCMGLSYGYSVYRGRTAKVSSLVDNSVGEISEQGKNYGKVLVIYYSMGGSTKLVADILRKKTGADVYEIRPLKKYGFVSAMFAKFRGTRRIELAMDNLPNLDSYDIVFIGSPVWAYSVSTPVLSFLERVDFRGKKVLPYATYQGSVGRFHEVFEKTTRNAKILRGLDLKGVKGVDSRLLENMISHWLANLEEKG
jgi:flavodoxin